MSLARFSIIVAIDANGGIAKEGGMPWYSRSDMVFFRDKTQGHGKNVVIMGRVTYETIAEENRPLAGRHNVVISNRWRQEDHPEISVYPNLVEALAGIGNSLQNYDEIYVAGGERIYNEAVENYLYLCDRIYITKFKTNYECDQFFPIAQVSHFPLLSDSSNTRDYTRITYTPKVGHPEYEYIQLLQLIKDKGEACPDRTGVGTRTVFGAKMDFDISDRIPLITTKKILWEKGLEELLWMLRGDTDSKKLEALGVPFWKDNTTRAELDKKGLQAYEVGDAGAIYGWQWRHWGAEYRGANWDYTGQGLDQLQNLIDGIREEPHSRRHILTAWNVADINKMCLPPCHVMCQFHVSGDARYLDCLLFQRSGDMFLGVPYNIFEYSVLTYMIAHLTGLRPRKLVHTIGEAHIYNNHADAVNRQLKRTPRPFPILRIVNGGRIHSIDDFRMVDFDLQNYSSWPYIPAKMAV